MHSHPSPLGAFALGCVGLAWAACAEAGAWPREPGATFLSARRDFGAEGGTALYGEYGLTRRITLGGQWSDGTEWTLPRTGAFVNVAIGDLGAQHRFAVSLGVSTTPDMLVVQEEARLDLGLHWGRGFESRFGGGWTTASYLIHLRSEGDAIHDLYGTVGVRPREGWMAMLSASRYDDGEGVYRKLTPAVGYEIRKDVWGIVQVTRELGKDRTTALGLSLWWSF